MLFVTKSVIPQWAYTCNLVMMSSRPCSWVLLSGSWIVSKPKFAWLALTCKLDHKSIIVYNLAISDCYLEVMYWVLAIEMHTWAMCIMDPSVWRPFIRVRNHYGHWSIFFQCKQLPRIWCTILIKSIFTSWSQHLTQLGNVWWSFKLISVCNLSIT